MNAKEHYRAAERWLETADRAFTEDENNKAFGKFAVANAQVHALLAQAATADPTLAVEDMGEYTAGPSDA